MDLRRGGTHYNPTTIARVRVVARKEMSRIDFFLPFESLALASADNTPSFSIILVISEHFPSLPHKLTLLLVSVFPLMYA